MDQSSRLVIDISSLFAFLKSIFVPLLEGRIVADLPHEGSRRRHFQPELKRASSLRCMSGGTTAANLGEASYRFVFTRFNRGACRPIDRRTRARNLSSCALDQT